jgi:acyl-coenzyme A thioesterase PaaI-like protein
MPSSTPGSTIRAAWRRLAPWPGGKLVFSWLIRLMVPYSGTTRPYVEDLSPGFARVRMADRRGVRNHLHSVHAVALANLAELASGLAMTTALPPGVRGIVTRLTIDYAKKARGALAASARVTVPPITTPEDHDFESQVTDAAGDVVARAIVRWRLAPIPPT